MEPVVWGTGMPAVVVEVLIRIHTVASKMVRMVTVSPVAFECLVLAGSVNLQMDYYLKMDKGNHGVRMLKNKTIVSDDRSYQSYLDCC